jgi:hypothetical protein
MKKFTLQTLAICITLAFSGTAMAQAMSKDDVKSAKVQISANYKAAKSACDSFSGNTKDICVQEAKGAEKVAKAELTANNEPSVKHHYAVRVAKADAAYDIAKEKCDDLAGNPKDVCVKEAKAAHVAAKADAKVQMKTTDANATAKEKTVDAQTKAAAQTATARTDASVNKKDAEYKVAIEKCDALAGVAKDACVTQAKARFNK